MRTLDLASVPPPRAAAGSARSKAADDGPPAGATVVRVPAVTARSGRLLLRVKLPPDYHFTEGANSGFETRVSGDAGIRLSPEAGSLKEDGEVAITFERSAGEGFVRVNAKAYFCQQNDVCLFEEVSFEVPFGAAAAGGGAADVELMHAVSPAAPVVQLPPL